jgi:hypothetical protein
VGSAGGVVFLIGGGVPDETDVARMVLCGRGDRLGDVPWHRTGAGEGRGRR